MIYHITLPNEWQKALGAQEYIAPSLAIEGFIHCSTQEQVAAVVQRYYAAETELLLLLIDENLLVNPLKWELSPSINESFPHVYGAINLNAIVQVEKYL
jgi:uncharacterized protein (DUF952 family)